MSMVINYWVNGWGLIIKTICHALAFRVDVSMAMLACDSWYQGCLYELFWWLYKQNGNLACKIAKQVRLTTDYAWCGMWKSWIYGLWHETYNFLLEPLKEAGCLQLFVHNCSWVGSWFLVLAQVWLDDVFPKGSIYWMSQVTCPSCVRLWPHEPCESRPLWVVTIWVWVRVSSLIPELYYPFYKHFMGSAV